MKENSEKTKVVKAVQIVKALKAAGYNKCVEIEKALVKIGIQALVRFNFDIIDVDVDAVQKAVDGGGNLDIF